MNNSTNATGTIDYVTLSLDTYNKLRDSAVALDSIISNTLAVTKLEPREETTYDKSRVRLLGNFVLPEQAIDGIANGIVDMLCSSDFEYILSLQAANKHFVDMLNFTFESYSPYRDNAVYVDLLNYPAFKEIWDAAEARNKYLEQVADGTYEADSNENAKVFETDMEFAGKFMEDADNEDM